MASGVNSTFRQVGIASGIAALGSIFAQQVGNHVSDGLAGTPAAAQSGRIADAVTGGQVQRVLENTPPNLRGRVADAATTAFVDGLNEITLIAAVLAFVAAVFAFILIRQKDFEQHGPPAGASGGSGAGAESVADSGASDVPLTGADTSGEHAADVPVDAPSQA